MNSTTCTVQTESLIKIASATSIIYFSSIGMQHKLHKRFKIGQNMWTYGDFYGDFAQ